MYGRGVIGGAGAQCAESQQKNGSIYAGEGVMPSSEVNNELGRLEKAVSELHGTVSALCERLQIIIIPEAALTSNSVNTKDQSEPIGSALGAQLRGSSQGVMYDAARLQDLMRQLAI